MVGLWKKPQFLQQLVPVQHPQLLPWEHLGMKRRRMLLAQRVTEETIARLFLTIKYMFWVGQILKVI